MRAAAILACVLTALCCSRTALADPAYASPYSVKFSFDAAALTSDLDGARGDVKKQSEDAYSAWYDPAKQGRYTTWGPAAQHFPMPPILAGKSADWMRERVLAVALRYVGYRYQHHHIPDWDPPQDWPYKTTTAGKQSKGLDCSNFTAWVYNLALGIKPTGETRAQSELTEVPGPGSGRKTKVQRLDKPASFADFAQVLKTGDLLYIKSRSRDEVSHVVMWVGKIGQSRSDVPLVIDSTGDGRKDETGASIPDGIYLRPFTANSWYCESCSHVLRFIPEGK